MWAMVSAEHNVEHGGKEVEGAMQLLVDLNHNLAEDAWLEEAERLESAELLSEFLRLGSFEVLDADGSGDIDETEVGMFVEQVLARTFEPGSVQAVLETVLEILVMRFRLLGLSGQANRKECAVASTVLTMAMNRWVQHGTLWDFVEAEWKSLEHRLTGGAGALAAEVFALMDENGDGYVSHLEFQRAWKHVATYRLNIHECIMQLASAVARAVIETVAALEGSDGED